MENGGTEETKDNPIDKIVSSIEARVGEKLTGHFGSLEEKLEALRAQEQAQKKDQSDDDDVSWGDDDDDEPLTKKELKDILLKYKDDFGKQTAQLIESTFNEKKKVAERDIEAFTDFPMLNKQSKYYDQDFEVEVRKEIDRRVKRGRKRNDLDLLYDSAATVKAKSPRWHKTIEEKAVDENRRYNNQEGGFSLKGKKQIDQSKPNENQIEFAKRMGLSKERLEEIMKKRAKAS